MLSWIFKCQSCRGPLENLLDGFCQICKQGIIKAPFLCPECFVPLCNCFCSKGVQLKQYNRSVLLLTPVAHRWVKKWKVNPHYLLQKQMKYFVGQSLKGDKDLKNLIAVSHLVPIPQSLSRVRTLGHSPPYQIAKILSKLTGAKIVDLLQKREGSISQAKKIYSQRLLSQQSFEINFESFKKIKNDVFLIDDIITTGQTMLMARDLLGDLILMQKIHFYSLGYRPPFQRAGADPKEARPKNIKLAYF